MRLNATTSFVSMPQTQQCSDSHGFCIYRPLITACKQDPRPSLANIGRQIEMHALLHNS
jgi:hypothetical protein